MSRRLLLLTYDELRVLWDALATFRRHLDIGDADFDGVRALHDRIGDLMADEFHRLRHLGG